MKKYIRIGKVSSIDYENGLISVTYPDLDDSVTDKIPTFSFTGEYKMPKIEDEVLVCHLSNGCTAGIVMGRYWNKNNNPAVYGENVFRKELAEDPGDAYLQYKDGTTTLYNQGDISLESGGDVSLKSSGNTSLESGGSLILKDKDASTTLGELISRIKKLESYH